MAEEDAYASVAAADKVTVKKAAEAAVAEKGKQDGNPWHCTGVNKYTIEGDMVVLDLVCCSGDMCTMLRQVSVKLSDPVQVTLPAAGFF
eukprot:CAMPEP_0205818998 /NCGR_PEP_ID=MMETSP0206-20130828/1149_1 /ASSEMBLY_ACC=CAM_ASM_000279 /TAXON_ID=36767 /ORGANISM="Euplotes focardii, Strain TN1" /LENGTH=88 /DNA_ID=CAMNT_0053111983 /DNA_START=51 /DNA_END=317 /DNA_ORIENTATION=+